jgi:hypothetical protein
MSFSSIQDTQKPLLTMVNLDFILSCSSEQNLYPLLLSKKSIPTHIITSIAGHHFAKNQMIFEATHYQEICKHCEPIKEVRPMLPTAILSPINLNAQS